MTSSSGVCVCGTANSAGRYYADIVKRHEEHARRTGGMTIQSTFSPLTIEMTSSSGDESSGDE